MIQKTIAWVLLLSLGYLAPAYAQDASNPFELLPRLKEQGKSIELPDAARDSAEQAVNPFDLIYEGPREENSSVYEVDAKVEPIITSDLERFKFFSVGIILLLLAVGVSLVGSTLNKSILSFVNDNSFNQYYREREGRGALPYYLLYLLFFINLGLFLVLLLNNLDVRLPIKSLFIQWLLLTGACTGLFLLKHFVLFVLRAVFPLESEVRRYVFLMVVTAVSASTLLIIFNLLMAYGPEGYDYYILVSAVVLAGIVYLFHLLRALFIANKFLVFHRFHFLLYICTVEIAPVFIMIRWIANAL